jgi:hypothetical protein
MPAGWTPIEEPTTTTAPVAPGWAPVAEAKPEKSTFASFTDFAKEALASLNPASINRGVQSLFWDPIGTLKTVGGAPAKLARDAEAAYKQGDYAAASRHLLNSVVPLVGPRLDEAGNLMQKGEIAKGLGATADVGLQIAGPLAARGRAPLVVKGMGTTVPEERAAIAFAQQRGIPVDAATATGGNAAVAGTQALADRSFGGSIIGQRARAAQGAALKATGEDIASRVNAPTTGPSAPVRAAVDQFGQRIQGEGSVIDWPAETGVGRTVTDASGSQVPAPLAGTAQTAEQAGTGVRGAIQARVDALKQSASASYDRFAETTQGAQLDTTPIKTALAPVLADLEKTMPLGLKQMSKPLTALRNIMDGPDVTDLATAESNRGSLLALQRMGDATPNAKRIIGKAIDELDASIMKRVDEAGPQARAALLQGRAATREKYATIDTLDSLSAEPVRIFNQATWAKDSGIDQLRSVQKVAPEQMRNLGRAWLDDALDKATAEGGFGHGDKLWANWEKLGPETKKVLFGEAHTSDLDKFFLLAKKAAANPNPSGSGYVATLGAEGAHLVFSPLTAIPLQVGLGAISKLLHSPAGVRLLTRGLTVPVKSAAGPMVAAALAKAIDEATSPPQPPASADEIVP